MTAICQVTLALTGKYEASAVCLPTRENYVWNNKHIKATDVEVNFV